MAKLQLRSTKARMPHFFLFSLGLLLATFLGCSKESDPESQPQEETKQEQVKQEDRIAPAAVPQTPKTAVIPAGTRLDIRLAESISSAQNQSGDTFESILNEDITANGRILAPRGSIVLGKLFDVQQSGRTKGRATMSLRLTDLRIEDNSYSIQTDKLSFEAEGTKKKDAAKIGAGAGIGAVVGAIAGGKKGAAIGAAIGGGAGTATVLATRGEELEFAEEQRFQFVLEEDVQVKLS